MFSKAALSLSILVACVAALPTTPPASECNTGPAQCCQSTQNPSDTDSATKALLGLLGIDISHLTGLIGLNCNPISVIGLGESANCAQQPVCCTNNNFNGVVSLGCTPISF